MRHEVDFKQLKIENKRYSEHYEEKNQELLKLKLTAGNTLQVLNSYKASNSHTSRDTTIFIFHLSVPVYIAPNIPYTTVGKFGMEQIYSFQVF